jgi:hypothetical protein
MLDPMVIQTAIQLNKNLREVASDGLVLYTVAQIRSNSNTLFAHHRHHRSSIITQYRLQLMRTRRK